ncbi:hypothetical protein F5B20DRAFT_588481 [Whalleya microplaca]|nr:hypothetical protein F5B20DRAFT_588481 [Whalleya microplaca]
MAPPPQIEKRELYDILSWSFSNYGTAVESVLERVAIREQQSIQAMIMAVRDEAGNTILHYAAVQGHTEIAELILSYLQYYQPELIPEFVNMQGRSGDLALHVAARGGHQYYCEVLIEAGAVADHQNAAGETALEVAKDSLAIAVQELVNAHVRLNEIIDEKCLSNMEGREWRRHRHQRREWAESDVDHCVGVVERLQPTVDYLKHQEFDVQRFRAELERGWETDGIGLGIRLTGSRPGYSQDSLSPLT